MSVPVRLRLTGLLAIALVLVAGVADRLAAAPPAFALSASSTSLVIPPGTYGGVDVTFRLAEVPVQPDPPELAVCTNSRVFGSFENPGCADSTPLYTRFGRGERETTVSLSAGRHEAQAYGGNGEESNVVVVVVKDECRWVGVSGPRPGNADTPPVLRGAPYPCISYLKGAIELSAEDGSTLVHSGSSSMIPGALVLANGVRISPGLILKLGLHRPYRQPARVRYRTRAALGRYTVQTITQAGDVFTRGQVDVEISHKGRVPRPGRRPTRVKVFRGRAVFVPPGVHISPGCISRPTTACVAKARRGPRRATLVLAGQTRILR